MLLKAIFFIANLAAINSVAQENPSATPAPEPEYPAPIVVNPDTLEPIDGTNLARMKEFFAEPLSEAEQQQIEARMQQAKELMGHHFEESAANQVHLTKEDLKKFIYAEVKESLRGKHQKQAKKLAKTILRQASLKHFDPMFIMAIIRTESSFNPEVVGPVGEIGLMQIRPETGKWLAKKIHMKWKGKKTLKDMEKNVILGATFLSMLRKQFNSHGRLYVSAYNIGARGVQRQIASAGPWPRSYALRVMRNYLDLYEELGQSKVPRESASN